MAGVRMNRRGGGRPFGLLGPTLVLALSIAPLAAQNDDLARVRMEFGEASASQIEAAVDRAVLDGLPRELLVAKAVEGAAKHMPLEAVLGAVRTLSAELQVAARVVGLDADAETLEKAADAIRHGVDSQLLIHLRRESPREFAVMVVAIEDLIHVGVDPSEAEDMLRLAAANGMSGDEVLGLPATVRRLVREGSTPRQAAQSVRANLGGGRSPGQSEVVGERFRDFPTSPTQPGRRIPPFL